jgi:hypothetical protein
MVAQFVLVQNNRVLAVSEYLACLPWSLINPLVDWKLALGTVNEFNEAEIVGVVAEAYPTVYEDSWLISSPVDRANTLITIQRRASLLGLVMGRLDRIYPGGVYEGDLCNLPQAVIAQGVYTKREL